MFGDAVLGRDGKMNEADRLAWSASARARNARYRDCDVGPGCL
jgi:hypothetical protein